MFVERDDGACRTCVGIFIQHDGRLFDFNILAEDLFGDEDVHIDIGLMQPHAFEVIWIDIMFGGFVIDEFGHHRHDLFEHAAAILNEELIRQTHLTAQAMQAVIFGRGVIEKAKIVADIIRKLGDKL